MTAATQHRLDGLEPDNLLAFLALLGLLRALEARDHSQSKGNNCCARAAWDVESPPLRPVVYLAQAASQEQLADAAAEGLEILAVDSDFGGQTDLNYDRESARLLLRREVKAASVSARSRADLLAALMTDAAIKQEKREESIDPTPLCLLFGQGHQHFLDRLAKVPREPAPPPRGSGKKAVTLSAAECLAEALFASWHRSDPTFSFRWDPEEDVRYALMAGDPTVAAYKTGSQHGANRLAVVGLAALTIVPEKRGGRVRPAVIGGSFGQTGFSLAWPIWREPATLSAIRAMLSHPDLRKIGAINHLSIDHVVAARRILVGKFLNFTRARIVDQI